VIAVSVCWVLCDATHTRARTHARTRAQRERERALYGAVVTEMGWMDEGVLLGIQWEAWLLRLRRQHFLISPLVPINAVTVV